MKSLPRSLAARAAPLRMLVVDDDALEVDLVASVLREALGEAILSAVFNGEDALAAIRAQTFDCVLIDYNMPRLDGMALGAAIKAEFPYLPLVLMTGVGYDMLVADALRGGFTDYIPKDRISAESVARVVRRAIEAVAQARLIAEQREELEHFAYALAHDFKQPIRQIRVFAELLGKALDGQDQSETTNYLRFLGDAAQRLSALVDVMSQYTLLNKAPELSMVDLSAVVANVGEALQGFIAERNGMLLSEVNASVYGNQTLMTQVLQNLVVNGLRYNDNARPRVLIRSEPCGVGKCRIGVSDNGIGIDARYLDQIFQPLMRLHSAGDYPGSGLGLTIARKAVLAQSGRIWCESRPGKGSVFWIEVNANAPDRQGADQAA